MICYPKDSLFYHTSSFFKGQYFYEFHEKVAFRENIIVNSYVSIVLLQCYILETISKLI